MKNIGLMIFHDFYLKNHKRGNTISAAAAQQVMFFMEISSFYENQKATYKRAVVRQNQRTLLPNPPNRNCSKYCSGIVETCF